MVKLKYIISAAKVILDKQIALPTNNSEDSKVDNAIDNAR